MRLPFGFVLAPPSLPPPCLPPRGAGEGPLVAAGGRRHHPGPAGTGRGRRRHRLGQRQRRRRVAHHRRRQHLAGRQPARTPPGCCSATWRPPDARHAQVLAIGEGEDSRILRTGDGGATWETTFVNDDPRAFYDCMAFFPGGRRGPRDERPGRREVPDHRDHRRRRQLVVVDPAGMPDAVDGEFGFAASGTCLVTAGGRDVWLASGGAASRVFHSRDRGHTWTVSATTIPASADDGAGVFSLSFRNPRQGLAVGGNLAAPRSAPTCRRTPATAAPPGPPAATSAATAPASTGCTAPRHGGRGRTDRQRLHPRRRAELDHLQRHRVRLGAVHPGRRVLGVRLRRTGRPPRPLTPEMSADPADGTGADDAASPPPKESP